MFDRNLEELLRPFIAEIETFNTRIRNQATSKYSVSPVLSVEKAKEGLSCIKVITKVLGYADCITHMY